MEKIRQDWDSPVVRRGLTFAPACWRPRPIWCCASPGNCLEWTGINSTGGLMRVYSGPGEIAFGGEICGL
jgi:hypothetical protein